MAVSDLFFTSDLPCLKEGLIERESGPVPLVNTLHSTVPILPVVVMGRRDGWSQMDPLYMRPVQIQFDNFCLLMKFDYP